MPTKAKKENQKKTCCPDCSRNALYIRKDGTSRCMRCGYDSRPKVKP